MSSFDDAALMRRAAVRLRDPYLCALGFGIEHALADWLDDAAREAEEVGSNPCATRVAQLIAFPNTPTEGA